MLYVIFFILYLVSLVAIAWWVRVEDRAEILEALRAGEIDVDGYWFKVQAVELPEPERVDHVSV